MAIPLNQGNFSGLASLAGNVTPNYNFPINGTSPLGSLFGGLAQGIQQNKENAFKQQQLDISNRYANVAEQNAALEQQMRPLEIESAQIANETARQKLQFEKTKMEIEAMSKLEESQLNKIRGLGAAGIIRMESAKTPEEQEQAKIDTLNMAVKEGILSEEQAQQFAQLPSQQFHATMTYYYQSATKGAELKEMRAPKEKSTGSSGTITYTGPDGSVLNISPSEKSTKTEVQKDDIELQKQITALQKIKQDFNANYLTDKAYWDLEASRVAEKSTGMIYEKPAKAVAEWFTGKTEKERSDYLKDATKYLNSLEQFFYTNRKIITGAQAAYQELVELRENVINRDMSPSELEGSIDAIMEKHSADHEIYRQVLEQGGVDITPKIYEFEGKQYSEVAIEKTAKAKMSQAKAAGKDMTFEEAKQEVLSELGAK